MATYYRFVIYYKYYTSCLTLKILVSNQGAKFSHVMTYLPTEQSDDNTTILQQTSLSSSLCTDDTQALLQVNAISQRVAIAKKELSSSSSGTSKFGSHDTMRTPSPTPQCSSFTPLLMSTPHPTAKSRLDGVAISGGVAEEVESISSINSEMCVASTEV